MPIRTTPASSASAIGQSVLTRRALLWVGIIAPILFATVFMIDGFLKPGYSAVDEAISYLEVGAFGWIQQVNFTLFGVLLLVFLAAYLQRMRPIFGQTWLYVGGVLLAISDLGWIMAGLCKPNPISISQVAWPAVLHQIAVVVIFLPLAIASFLLGTKLVRTRGWRLFGGYYLVYGLIQAVFPLGTIAYLLGPASFGNVHSPNDGVINRLVLLVGPFAWYLISATIGLLKAE